MSLDFNNYDHKQDNLINSNNIFYLFFIYVNIEKIF